MAPPDVDIFPHATGKAAELVARHESPQEIVFWSGWFCPFNQRAWIALEERGIPYQYKEVNPYKKEKHFLEINPKGLVPAFEYKGKALYESLVLTEFLEDAYPDHKPHLFSSDPFTRAHQRIWIDFITKSVVPAWQRLLMAQGTEKQDAAREELYAAQRKFAEQVKGPYFSGEEFSLVDIAIAPWIERERIVTEHRAFKSTQVSKEYVTYVGHILSRPSVINTSSDQEKYQPIYDRYLRDEAQSEAAKAIRAGRPLP
ncbi:glutathione S-transferase [Hygrophoropsis aurantiaca]|uniref:Glutathione S-transferase n=1 Tax=Hygrophoropsis aurantiaca TaxID=72124 RepID=A0ACB8AAC6_9AGAM|nr:glutathione S-transferase [Hygrophoropsis aurantiaca]